MASTEDAQLAVDLILAFADKDIETMKNLLLILQLIYLLMGKAITLHYLFLKIYDGSS
ncbi:MAG: hypothetical protein CM15mP22_0580 [Gammaproteobacteria bacterium]|nr:MAG: hypothetical protein CM15mP22_0580 [Gammaproteobacteria bacterium]